MAPLRPEEEKIASDDISQEKQMEEFFQWTPDPSLEPETMGQKFRRKTTENPFVPIGKFSKLLYIFAISKLLVSLYYVSVFVMSDRSFHDSIVPSQIIPQYSQIIAQYNSPVISF